MTEPVYIREGFANMLKGKEGVGGKLYLDRKCSITSPMLSIFKGKKRPYF